MLSLVAAMLLATAPPTEPEGWRWTARDLALQATFALTMAVDWRQTLAIARGPRFEGYTLEESNPILGPRPSASRVTAYFAATTALHAGLALALPHPWRTWWQLVGLGVETHAIGRNVANGVTVRMMF